MKININAEKRFGSLENLYLKLFKGTVVVLMTLAMLAVVTLIPTAAYLYFQTPRPPAPAQPAAVKKIELDDLRRSLIEDEKRRQEQKKRVEQLGAAGAAAAVPASETAGTLPFIGEANSLINCLDEFRRLTNANVIPQTEQQKIDTLTNVRTDIQRYAQDKTRGEAWVTAMVTFVCLVLKDPMISDLAKESKIDRVFGSTIRFHANAWTTIMRERQKLEESERMRVQGEIAAEDGRIMLSKAFAMSALITAGSAFGMFLFLALYLIFARIERNLAGIESKFVFKESSEPVG